MTGKGGSGHRSGTTGCRQSAWSSRRWKQLQGLLLADSIISYSSPIAVIEQLADASRVTAAGE